MRSPSGRAPAPARPSSLVKLIVTAIAALLLLVGPLLSSALALERVRVGKVGAMAFSFVPTNVGQEVGIFVIATGGAATFVRADEGPSQRV